MIVGIGCDIADHSIAEKLNWKSDKKFLERVFSANEIQLYQQNNKLSFLTGRFAAKEAVVKCLGTGMYDGISLREIDIVQLKNGKPSIELYGEAKKISEHLGIKSWHVSISHCPDSSIAYVIAENHS